MKINKLLLTVALGLIMSAITAQAADINSSNKGSSQAALQINPLQVALLKWAPYSGVAFPVGTGPIGVAFDGANIWVANGNSNSVTKLRASDGAIVGTFTVGNSPSSVAVDGTNIWVTNVSGSNVTKLRASDGTVLGTFSVGSAPRC